MSNTKLQDKPTPTPTATIADSGTSHVSDSTPIAMPETSALTNDQPLWLLWLIEGESSVFDVTVPHGSSVYHLRRLVHGECKSEALRTVDARDLVLLKVNIELGRHNQDSLRRLKFGENDEGVEKLTPWHNILTYWPDQPDKGHLHIIVKVPATDEIERFFPFLRNDSGFFSSRPQDIRGKRAAPEPAESVLDRLKRAKIVGNVPSETGGPMIYELLLQENASEKILDDRPKPVAGIPPISLLYEGYGHFLDIMDARDDVPGLADVNVRELQDAVDDLASKMTGYFINEETRRDSALRCINRIFSARRGTEIPQLHASAIGSVRTDGHNIAAHGAATMVVEVRNWSTGISSLPEIEMACNAARLFARGMDDKTYQQLYLRWRVPCVGLTIVGCDIRFYAVITSDHRLRVLPLTYALSCLQFATEGRDRRLLYSAFTAASVLQAHILQDITRLLGHLPAVVIPTHARFLPAVSKLRKYPSSQAARQSSNLVAGGSSADDDYLVFRIGCIFPDKQPNRLLYAAEDLTNKDLVLVKFSKHYSIELHEFCANSDHAPQILAYERLPGGWYAVAMEYFESGIPITDPSHPPDHRDRWMAEVQHLVDGFHDKDLVHGDLRDANIICNEDSMMLVDFDWGGKVGEVFYPTWNLNDELLQGRVSNDLMITKEDDRRVLMNTLDKIRVIPMH